MLLRALRHDASYALPLRLRQLSRRYYCHIHASAVCLYVAARSRYMEDMQERDDVAICYGYAMPPALLCVSLLLMICCLLSLYAATTPLVLYAMLMQRHAAAARHLHTPLSIVFSPPAAVVYATPYAACYDFSLPLTPPLRC